MKFLKVVPIIVATFFAQQVGFCQKTEPIADSLKRGADAVFRTNNISIEVQSPSRYTIKRLIEITVLNERGRHHTDFVVSYTSDSPVRQMRAELFDSGGKRIKRFSGKDINDVSPYSSTNLYDDLRQKQIEVYYGTYPYTVVFEYTQEVRAFINYPNWYPQVGYRVGVENAIYIISFNEDNPLRYRVFNLSDPDVSKKPNGYITYIWEISGLKPIEYESCSPNFFEITPSIFIVPECFSYKGTTGCYNTWETYGSWVSGLLANRSDVSKKLVDQVTNLVKDIDDEREKVKAIYKFMQNQTRYVSIQLGLGGFQPFPASTVEATGYGDCKALSNYTKTLLSIANIKSHYCEIGVHNRKIWFEDFPSPDQTNHIILCVPLANDTIWLECTSQRMPFGYLPHSHQNQKVVLINEEDGTGKIVSTPNYPSDYNIQERKIELQIDPSGNVNGRMFTKTQGGEIDNLTPELWLPDGEREKIINRKYPISGFKLNSFKYSLEESDTTRAFEEITMSISRYASRTGNRMFVKVNPFGGLSSIPTKNNNRKNDLVINTNRTHIDTLVFTIPEGYRVEALPREVDVITKFGSIKVTYSLENNKFNYHRVFTLTQQRLPPSEFNGFVDFLIEANRADSQSFVLVAL